MSSQIETQIDKDPLTSDLQGIQGHGGGLILVHNTGHLEDTQAKLWNFPSPPSGPCFLQAFWSPHKMAPFFFLWEGWLGM